MILKHLRIQGSLEAPWVYKDPAEHTRDTSSRERLAWGPSVTGGSCALQSGSAPAVARA